MENYFIDAPVDIFGGSSMIVNLFIYGNMFDINCSTIKFTDNLHYPF